jgi:hypothetical protein
MSVLRTLAGGLRHKTIDAHLTSACSDGLPEICLRAYVCWLYILRENGSDEPKGAGFPYSIETLPPAQPFGMLAHRADDLVVSDRGRGCRGGAVGGIVGISAGSPASAKCGEPRTRVGSENRVTGEG